MSYKYRAKYLSKISIVSSLSIILTACGGGSSNSSEGEKPEPAVPNATYSTVTGVASAATPLANAQVTANCKDNTGFKDTVTTDNDGKWSAKIDSSKFPCGLEVKFGAGVYHSYVTSATTVNITPLTDVAIALATNQMPVDWYKSGKEISADKLASATNLLVQELTKKNYNLPDNFNPFTAVTSASISQLLSDFLAALAANSATIKDYSALLTLVKDGNIGSLPKKIVLPVPTTLIADKTACQVVQEIALPKGESLSSYDHCLATTIPDFSNSSLLPVLYQDPCLVEKVGGKLTVSQGSKSISATLDGEEEDQFFLTTGGNELTNGTILGATTGNISVGFTIASTGKLVSATGTITDQSGNETVIGCAGPR